MSRVNIYIRKEDEASWAAVTNKSEFIHNALNGLGGIKLDSNKPFGGTVIKTKQDATAVVKEVFPGAKPIGPVTYKKTSNWGA